MSTSHQTAPSAASVGSPIIERLPRVVLRECEPWCEEGDGHPTAHPEDRRCCATNGRVTMSLHDPINWGKDEGWVSAHVNVELRREPDESQTRMLLNFLAGGRRGQETDEWFELTVDEFERLVANMSSALKVARGA